MYLLLWILAVILVIFGVVRLVQGDILWGIVLIVLGLLVGPGGVSFLDFDDDDPDGAPAVVEQSG